MIPVTMKDYALDIARGDILGAEPFGAYGKKVTVAAESTGLLWANGDWSIPSVDGEQISVVSTSLEDGVGGTGIRSLHVHYLDAELNPASEVLVMNGTTPVLTTATDIRFIQCSHVEAVGTSKEAVGSITFKNLAGTKTYNQLSPTEVRCSSSLRMVPKGKRAVILGLVGSSISGTAAASSTVEIVVSSFYGHDYTLDEILLPLGTIGVQDGSIAYTLPVPHIAEEGTLVGMTCSTDKAATITGDWFGWLESSLIGK